MTAAPDAVIAGVLAEHRADMWACSCGWPLNDSVGSWTEHVAAALLAAGIGPVAQAVTDEEAQEVDQMMNDHMYHHAISNSYASFACDPRCRKEALRYAIGQMLRDRAARIEQDTP